MDNKKQTKPSKAEKLVEELKSKVGYQVHQVLKENTSTILIAFGFENRNYNVLFKHDVVKKTNENLKIDSTMSFSDFVDKEKK